MIIFLNLEYACAHGENKLGSHEGYIRMPGTFHTELVPLDDGTYNIYLMDVSNQNATIKNSEVKLFYKSKSKKIEFSCLPLSDHFTCKTSEPLKNEHAELVINAIRLGKKSVGAVYELPLSLTRVNKSTTGDHEKNMIHKNH